MAKASKSRPRARPSSVGYGRPPKHTQFRPGQSGNPSGRPKRSTKGLHQQLAKELSTLIAIDERNPGKKIPLSQLIAKRLVHLAAKGDIKGIAMVLKVYESLEHEEPSARAAEAATFAEVDEIVIADFVRRVQLMPPPPPSSLSEEQPASPTLPEEKE